MFKEKRDKNDYPAAQLFFFYFSADIGCRKSFTKEVPQNLRYYLKKRDAGIYSDLMEA